MTSTILSLKGFVHSVDWTTVQNKQHLESCLVLAENFEKVAFDGRVKEEITIPAGSKILCFHGNPEPGTRQPELNLVYVTYDD